jgi:hypothetical protein
MGETLKKRWSCPDRVVTHIFEGELNDGVLKGFHSEAVKSIENGQVRVVGQPDATQWNNRLTGRVYQLYVEVKFGASWKGPKTSTFFPHPLKEPHPDRLEKNQGAKFTKANIVTWIEQALTKHTDSDRPSREAWTDQPRAIARHNNVADLDRIKINGVSCHVEYDPQGIASVYPSTLG